MRFVYFFESVSFERFANAKKSFVAFFSELYRVRWMMYGKFSFFFKFCIRVQTKQKILKAETKIVSSGVDLCYTNTLIHARTLKINYL